MSGGALVGIVAFGLLIGLAAALVGLLAGRKIFGDRVEVAMRRSGETRWRHGLLEVNPSLHVIDIETDRGALELGVQAHQVDDLRARLQPTADLH